MDKIRLATYIGAEMPEKFQPTFCDYDRTAIVLHNISEKELNEICRKHKCSGLYRPEKQRAIVTNFGEYN